LEVELAFLVEIVTDAGAVREQMLDRDVLGDQRQVVPEHRARRRRELETTFLDQAHERQGRQSLRPARNREAGVEHVRDFVCAVREAVRLRHYDAIQQVDANDAREPRLGGDLIEPGFELGHRRRLLRSEPAR
jgi:hypothetical protein